MNRSLIGIWCILIMLFSTKGLAQHNMSARDNDQEIALANEYYSQGEWEKAISLYEKIVKDPKRIEKVHRNYFRSLVRLGELKTAEKYLKRQLRTYTFHPMFNIDYGLLLQEKGDMEGMAKHYNNFLESIKSDGARLKNAAIYFIDAKFYEYAEKAYNYGKKYSNENYSYELGELYFLWGKKELMMQSFLDLLLQVDVRIDRGEIAAVQAHLQEKLAEGEEFDALEPVLFSYVQRYAGKLVYNEMLVWFYLQKKSFYKAFMQAKAIDRRLQAGGMKIMDIAKLAYNNEEFKTAVKIYDFLVKKYSNKPIYGVAKNMLVQSKEEVVKRAYPVDLEQIRSLVSDYQETIKEFGIRSNTADAVRNMAKLYAFYLNDRDTAITILTSMIQSRQRIPQIKIDQSKLDLGDIYLLKGEPWEATLIYSQVEKTQREKNLGHLAKLKNAKLSYYKGDFQLAKGHLDVLKLATSREIANDAMDLSLLIQDNLELDTSEVPMQDFAQIDLLVFQNQYDQALVKYDKMLTDFKGHTLTDEILWRKANIFVKLGKAEEAVKCLEGILEKYDQDILADDATFLAGKIYEETLKNKDKAKLFYLKILKDYPGSIYVAEARKRARLLRGDKL
ncbi:MAG: tetratricopeptide repeat protein [Flammeovirgaceae bacterium]